MSDERLGFRFGPPQRRAALGGIRSGQLAVVVAALGLSVGLLRSTPARVGLPIALLCVVAAVAFAFVPIRGETPQEWLPTLVAHLTKVALTQHRGVGAPLRTASVLRAPGPFADLRLLELGREREPRDIGVVVDTREATWTAALSVRPVALALAGLDERERLVGTWARVLAAVSMSPHLYRLQWIERTVPDRADVLRSAIEAAYQAPVDPNARAPVRGAQRSYSSLVDAESAGVLRHECFLALTVRGPRRISTRGAAEETYALLASEVDLLATRCRDAGLAVQEVLSPSSLSVVLREATEELPATRPGWPWPLASEEAWGQLRTDGTVHATYWVAEWPRRDVPGDFLLPLIVAGRERRTLSVTVAPVDPIRAVHEAEHARTADRADAALRARHGFALTARNREDGAALMRRERELAQGHAAFRFSGYVTVTAPCEEVLASACARVEQSAALAHLDLRRLYGLQGEGFLATLPLGRGCA